MLSFITQNGQTPLMWVEWTRMRVIVDLLIDHGADVNTIDNDGRSALTYAVTTFSPDPEVKNYSQIEVTTAETAVHKSRRRYFQ
jgi:ankyrin repeat protein